MNGSLQTYGLINSGTISAKENAHFVIKNWNGTMVRWDMKLLDVTNVNLQLTIRGCILMKNIPEHQLPIPNASLFQKVNNIKIF